MKIAGLSLVAAALLIGHARADVTIVQDVASGGQVNEMTIKIKGDKARIDPSPQVSTIIDSKTGEMLNLMHDQKKFLRISADAAKAVAEMAVRADPKKQATEKPKLKPTGKKETINGHQAEEYVCEAPAFTATYWISTNHPDAAAIVKQLQAMSPDAWGVSAQGMPDYRDFPGLPLRSTVNMSGTQITSTLKTVKQDPLNDAEFTVPAGFEEMKMPDMGSMFGSKPDAKAKPAASPKK